MFFGLFNALASFQSYINKILAKKPDVFVIVYLDNILIYTENKAQDHMEAVRWVLDLLKKIVFLLIWKNVCFIRMRFAF